MKRIALWGLAVIAALLLAAELGLRAAGVLDFPLYRQDAQLGYIERPSQSGTFMRRRRWAYNDRSLGVGEPFRPEGVLLVGDSVVNSGGLMDQEQRIGPRLSQMLGAPVWPLAAGGWALDNELQALKAGPERCDNQPAREPRRKRAPLAWSFLDTSREGPRSRTRAADPMHLV